MGIYAEFREFQEWKRQRRLAREVRQADNERPAGTPMNKDPDSAARITQARTRRIRRSHRQ